jgi:hypothetical protein
MSCGERRNCCSLYRRGRVASASCVPSWMQTRASWDSKSSRLTNRNVIRRDDGHARADCEVERAGDPLLLPGPPRALQLEVVAIAKEPEPVLERRTRFGDLSRQHGATDIAFACARKRDETAGRIAIHPGAADRRTVPRASLEIRAAHESRQVAIAALVAAQQHETARLRALAVLAQPDVDADQRLDTLRERSPIELDEREQVALVRHRDRGHAEPGRGVDEPLARELAAGVALAVDTGDAVDERVLGVHVKVDETRHARSGECRQMRSEDCTGA